MLIRNQWQEADQWFEENINEFGLSLGNHIYLIHEDKYDLFLERIRKEVDEKYSQSSNGSIKIKNMKVIKNSIIDPDQAPAWFGLWVKNSFNPAIEKQEKFNEEQREFNKQIIQRIDNLVKINNLKE